MLFRSAMPATDLGKILHSNQAVVEGLRHALNIYRHPPFQSFVKYEPVASSVIPSGSDEFDLSADVTAPVLPKE